MDFGTNSRVIQQFNDRSKTIVVIADLLDLFTRQDPDSSSIEVTKQFLKKHI